MGQLALIWDGTWLTWTSFDQTQTIGRREISSPSMVREVLKALRKQVDAGTSVIHAEWGRPATAIPLALLSSPREKEAARKLHETLHGPVQASHDIECHALEALDDCPCLAVEHDVNWGQSLTEVFPQSRPLPLVHALVHDALQLNRQDGHRGWTFRIDVRNEGALMVAVSGEALQWVHHLNAGFEAEDALYAMVNVAHRAGVAMETCRACWSGDDTFVSGWSRFMDVRTVEHQRADANSNAALHMSWWPLFQSMKACG